MRHEGNGTTDDVIRSLQRKLAGNPGDFSTSLGLINAYLRAGWQDEAFEVYSALAQSHPEKYNSIVKAAIMAGLAEYRVGPTSRTYAQEAHAVKRASNELRHYEIINGIAVPRMPTFEENIRARVEDYNTLTDEQGNPRTMEQRLALFRKWLSSCSAVVYEADSGMFKIEQASRRLMEIEEGFNQPFMETDYATAEGVELDSSQGIYSFEGNYRPLTREQALKHKFWNAAVQRKTLEEYIKIYFDQRESGMGVWIVKNPKQNQLRALGLGSLGYDSGAGAGWGLSSSAQSLRVAQR